MGGQPAKAEAEPNDFWTLEELGALPREERAQIRAVLETEFSVFCRWAFQNIFGGRMQWTLVQGLIACFLVDVGSGKITRGIINTKPRFGKSLLLALWIAWWLCKRPTCKFMYLSGSDILARDQSKLIRDIVSLPHVRCLWEIDLKKDTRREDLWRTKQGGYLRAVSTGGQVIGFGAGELGADEFRGALIIDDPNKPDDRRHVVKLEAENGRYMHTIRNRINDPKTPILIVQQRLGDNDMSGFLLAGATGETWHHCRIPGLYDETEEERAQGRYTVDWTGGQPYDIPIEFRPPDAVLEVEDEDGEPIVQVLEGGYVWPEKFGSEQDQNERLDEETWAAQTMQSPRVAGGSLLRVSWLGRYDRFDVDTPPSGRVWYQGNLVDLRFLAVMADTACKTGDRHDWSVLELWGVGTDGGLYLLDMFREKLEAPELLEESTRFLKRYEDKRPRAYGWREVYIEDKSSGVGLIQQLQRAWGARVIPVQRGKDKVSRALSTLIPLKDGLVRIPADSMAHPWVPAFLTEYAAFSKDMTHQHDDQLDPLFDAVEILGRAGGKNIYNVVSSNKTGARVLSVV